MESIMFEIVCNIFALLFMIGWMYAISLSYAIKEADAKLREAEDEIKELKKLIPMFNGEDNEE